MKVAFHTNQMCLRGTEIAIYDYAKYNEELLNNESIIFCNSNNELVEGVVRKFESKFKCHFYSNFTELEAICEKENIEHTYFIKSGFRDGLSLKNSRNLIHAVFPTDWREFHGDRLAFVSKWLSKEHAHSKIPYVPHMIDLKPHHKDRRDELGIKSNHLVIGCYGGQDSFNLKFVHEEILKALSLRQDLVFVFMNIAKFANHERLLFLPGDANLDNKIAFINTCDAMIHARGIGESFGLACGEFSIMNKPVITYSKSPQRSHLEILGSKALTYDGRKDLLNIFLNLDKKYIQSRDWDAYSQEFNPGSIMKLFQSVFLSEEKQDLSLNLIDKAAIQAYRFQRKIRNLSKKLYL
jgi:hypothetical protein